jgi:hypothetical protein
MRAYPMTQRDLRDASNPEIIEQFRQAAIERGNTGFNWRLGNRILEQKMLPAYHELVARGPDALKGLLTLTADSNPNVRKSAAIMGYDRDPARCTETLKRLFDEPGWVSVMALVGLLHKNSGFAAEYSQRAKLKHQRRLRERDQLRALREQR